MNNVLQFPSPVSAADKFKVDDALAGYECFLPWTYDPEHPDEVLSLVQEVQPVDALGPYTGPSMAQLLALDCIASTMKYGAKDTACVAAARILSAIPGDIDRNGPINDFLAAYIHYLLKTMNQAMEAAGVELPQSH